MILSYILKTIWCINILSGYEFIQPEVWLQNKCKSLWTIIHGLVIFALYFDEYLMYKWFFLIMGQYDSKFQACYLLPYVLYHITVPNAEATSNSVELSFHVIDKEQFRQAMLSCNISHLFIYLFIYLFITFYILACRRQQWGTQCFAVVLRPYESMSRSERPRLSWMS